MDAEASPSQPPQRPSSGSRLTPSKGTSSSKVVAGDYQLAGKLGRGGSGVVYKAIHRLKGHIVAIKVISVLNVPKDQISNVEAEIRLMRGLKHPNIVKYIDSKLEGSDLCIVLEYVEGGSLSKIMHDVGQGTLPESLVTIYISKMLRGLVYLHSEGVIHRDIKAANILVDRDGEVRLADFGVAIQTQSSTMGSGAVRDVVGTPYWMAPEVIKMSGATDRSDVWSVGCTVIELLTGAPPYSELGQVPALFRIVQDVHPPLPDLTANDPVLHDFLMRCFQKDPLDRADAQSLSEHRWLLEMRESIESQEGALSVGSSAAQLDEPLAKPAAGEGGLGSPWPDGGEGAERGLDSTITIHRQISDTIQSQRSNLGAGTLSSTSSLQRGSLGLSSFTSVSPPMPPATLQSDAASIEASLRPERLAISPALPQPEPESELQRPAGDPWSDDIEGSGLNFTISPRGGEPRDVAAAAAAALEAEIQPTHLGGETGSLALNGGSSVISSVAVGDGEGGEGEVDEETKEIARLIRLLNVKSKPALLQQACAGLARAFIQTPARKESLISQHGIIPLMEILEVGKPRIKVDALILINQIVRDDPQFQQKLCLVGLLPLVVQLGFSYEEPGADAEVEAAAVQQQLLAEVVRFVAEICRPQSSTLALQVFIACDGLKVLSSFLEKEVLFRPVAPDGAQRDGVPRTASPSLTHLVIDSIWSIFNRESRAKFLLPNLDICRLFVKAGVLAPLAKLLRRWIRAGDEAYQERLVNLFVQFARGDEVVREAMAAPAVLEGIMYGLAELNHVPRCLLKLLHCVARMTMCAAALEALEQAQAVPQLATFTNPQLESIYAFSEADAAKIRRAALLSLYYLCGGKAIRQQQFQRRQEVAASSGLIKHLQHYIHTHSDMEHLALHMFCALPYAGQRVRTRLWQEQAHLFYIALLEHREQYWRLQALEALALWLADGQASAPKRSELERVMLQPKHVAKLVPLFRTAPDEAMVAMLPPYMQLLKSSKLLARACSPLAPDVLARLGNDQVFGVNTTIDLLRVLHMLLNELRTPATFIEEHSLDGALWSLFKRKQWDQKPIVGNVATEVLDTIEKYRG